MSEDSPTSPPPPQPPAKQENPLLNLLLNVLLPVLILSYLSKEGKWYSTGPKMALALAVLLPVGYAIWDYRQRRKMNVISIIGLVSVLLTGGLGLLELSAQAFALKEASMPLAIGAAFIITHWVGKPLAASMLMNPDIMDVPRIQAAVERRGEQAGLARLLWHGTLLMTLSFAISAVSNYFLAMYFLSGTAPGTEAYNQGIAKQTGWGYAVIGLPMMLFLGGTLFYILSGLGRVSGLSRAEIMKG